MMETLFKFIAGLFVGRAGEEAGTKLARAAEAAAWVAAAAPVALWLKDNKDATFIEVTYGDVAFWGSIMLAGYALAIRQARRAPPPE